ncbi:TonB-dependent receptor [soil metagenome]
MTGNRIQQRSRHATIYLAGLALALPATLGAQAPTPAPDTVPQYRIEGVNVTVTRTAARAEDVPRRIDVITATDLNRTPADELADVLKKQAAVDVIQYPGLLSGVGIRGFRPQFSGINQRTLVLVDGRPAGASNLALLSLHNVERIEVLKGPASALYGSNAMGGVVNIITRRSEGRLGATASVGYGSWSTREASATAGGTLAGAFDFDLGVSLFDRGGDYRVGNGNVFRSWIGDGTLTRQGATSDDAPAGSGEVRPFTQYGTRSGNLRLGYRLGEAWRVDARAERFQADRVQNPGDLFAVGYDPRTLKDVERTAADVTLSGALARHNPLLRIYTSREGSDHYNTASPASSLPQFISFRSPTRWRGVQLQDAVRFGAHTLTAGVDASSAQARSEAYSEPGTRSAAFSPDSEIESRALFGEGRFSLLTDRLVGTLGGRFERIGFRVEDATLADGRQVTANTETFAVFTPSAGLQARLGGGLRVNATRGHAFVTPDAFQVAGYSEAQRANGVVIGRGNPGLDPENSVTHDLGLALVRRDIGLDAEVTYFRTDVRDRIATRRTIPTAGERTTAGDSILSITSYQNVDEAEIRGLEWRLGYDLGALRDHRFALRLFTNATHILRAEEISAAATSRIRNVAELTLNYGVEFDDLRRFSTRVGGRYVGERTDMDFSDFSNPADVTYPRFMVLDLATEVRFADRYRIGLLVDNLTDENYFEVRGFPLPGRTLRLRFTANY